MATILSIVNGQTKFHQNTTLPKVRESFGFVSSAFFVVDPNKGNKISDVNEVRLNDVLLHGAFIGKVVFFANGHRVVLESITSGDRNEVDSRKCLYLCPASELKGLGLANQRLQADASPQVA